MAKMMMIGLGNVIVWWINAYFSGRVSRVNVGGEHSRAIPMHSGVSQVSLTGPFLLLLFVNDLPDVGQALTQLWSWLLSGH